MTNAQPTPPGPILGVHLTDAAPGAPEAVSMRGSARGFYALGFATLIGYGLYIGRDLLIPLMTAAFLSFLIFTLKENFRRLPGVGRFVPHWLAYIFAFALIFSVLFLFVEIVKSNISALIEAAPEYERRLREAVDRGIDALNTQKLVPVGFIGNALEQLRTQALDMIQPLLSRIAGSARAILTNTVIIFLYTVFILVERGRIFRKIALLSVEAGRRRAIDETISDIGTLVRQYLTVKTLSNLVTAGASFIIMLAVGVDFAGFWALAIFSLNYIPIFGAASAITLPVLLALVQPDGGVQKMLLLLGLLIGFEQIMSNVIEPRLVGKSLNLSPLVILIALAFWGSIWGFAGFLLAVPMTVSGMLILTQFQSTRPIAILMSDEGEIAELKHPAIGG